MTAEPKFLLNGDPAGRLSPFDRGLQFGDGVFETLAVREGIPEDWRLHCERLVCGSQRLGLPVPQLNELRREADELCRHVATGVLKIVWTRGEGLRGYSLPSPVKPTRFLALHPRPFFPDAWYQEGITVRICETRLSRNERLAGIKHLNRLEQVLGRSEWQDADIAEGLMLDTENNLIEGTMSNLFLVTEAALLTAELSACGIEGIVRRRIIEESASHGFSVVVRKLTLEDLLQATEAFVCNSIIGAWSIQKLVGPTPWSATNTTVAAKIRKLLYPEMPYPVS